MYFTDDGGKAQQEPTKLVFGKSAASELNWSDWGSDTARATGRFREASRKPSCADGEVLESKASVTLSGISECDGVEQYTSGTLKLTYPDGETYNGDLCSGP